jgi:hypothetical protein
MRRWAIFPLLLALVACGKQDDAKKLQQAVTSWGATLQIVADARLRNEVRDAYALKTVEAAVDDVSGQAGNPSLPRPVTLPAERVIAIAGRLRRALENDDRSGIANARAELASFLAASK